MSTQSPMDPPSDEHKGRCEHQETVSEIFLDFADVTTAHGYGHLISTRSIILKFFWVISILICHIFIVIHIHNLTVKYLSRPVVTTIESNIKDHLTFPVVVLCNENMIKNDQIGDAFDNLKKAFGKLGREVPEFLLREHFNILASELKDGVHKYGHSFETMVERCHLLDRHECKNYQYWERYWHGRYGSCYVFNADTYTNGTKKETWKVFDVGPSNALSIDVNIEQPYYFANLSYSAGIRLYIGHQNVFYEPYTQGHSFGAGFEYSIGVRMQMQKRSDRFDNGSCIENRPMEFFHYGQRFQTFYDQKICVQLCKSQHTVRKCNCFEYHSPVLNASIETCGYHDEDCMRKAKKEVPRDCLETCQPPCIRSQYDMQVSSLIYPSNVQQFRYQKSLSLVREDILRLIIYFRELEVEVWEDKLYYSVENLFSDIGGQLGLFSGYSVLTVLEFFVLFGVLLKFYAKVSYKARMKVIPGKNNDTPS